MIKIQASSIPVAQALSQAFHILFFVANIGYLEPPPNPVVCIFKTGRNYSWNPKDGTVRISVANSLGGLDCELDPADAAETLEGNSPTVIFAGDRRHFVEELLQSSAASNEVLVALKRDREMALTSNLSQAGIPLTMTTVLEAYLIFVALVCPSS
ncbi:putative kinesin light [Rosellinia necatrix]|uniref:Putative kinesin light n=1 Tax=Rosellinia necatrix TaxID=77044 RepID=A0A1W2TAH8_ROSNE|nr:putative kinesin light [Rosellinia necatrix]